MQEYVMVPRSLISDCELNDKRVLAYSSILFSGWGGENILELVSYSRFSLRRDAGSVLHQYKELVNQFIIKRYFKDDGMKYIKQNDCFGIIYYDEFDKILKTRDKEVQNKRRINHSHALLLLSYIRLYMVRQPGVPHFYSNLLSRISNNIGISVRNITKALKVLEELNIIHSEELPRYKDNNGCWHSNVRIFVNMKTSDVNYDWENEVEQGIKYIMASQMN